MNVEMTQEGAHNMLLDIYIYILELKPIVVAIQWALVRTYWIDEPLE